jgi:hypothetical protein
MGQSGDVTLAHWTSDMVRFTFLGEGGELEAGPGLQMHPWRAIQDNKLDYTT